MSGGESNTERPETLLAELWLAINPAHLEGLNRWRVPNACYLPHGLAERIVNALIATNASPPAPVPPSLTPEAGEPTDPFAALRAMPEWEAFTKRHQHYGGLGLGQRGECADCALVAAVEGNR